MRFLFPILAVLPLFLAACSGDPISAREGAARFYTEIVDDTSGSPHAVDRCWRVAEHLGAAARNDRAL